MTQKKDGEVGLTVFDTVQCESEEELGVDTTALFFCVRSFLFACGRFGFSRRGACVYE